jgi:hypothetical protein
VATASLPGTRDSLPFSAVTWALPVAALIPSRVVGTGSRRVHRAREESWDVRSLPSDHLHSDKVRSHSAESADIGAVR